ncbi:MAG: ABC transporter substrate-binding protein [Acidimicrobiales bacterium]
MLLQRSIGVGLATLVALVAVACSGGLAEQRPAIAPAPIGVDESALKASTPEATVTSAPAPPAPSTTIAREASWGVRDGRLVGPAGFEIDLGRCPRGWSDTAGLSDKEIRLGLTYPRTGAFAALGQLGAGMKAYFDHVNASEGGVAGRKLTLVAHDDYYDPAEARVNVDSLLGRGNVFALTGVVGTRVAMATNDRVNEACAPNLFPASNHPAWGDPVFHPWTAAGPTLPLTTEAQLWVRYLADAYGPTTTVAALVLNDELGFIYKAAFELEAARLGLRVSFVTHDPASPNIAGDVAALAATNADVAVLMTTASFCPQAFAALAASSWRPKERLVSATCQSIPANFAAVGAAGVGWAWTSSAKDVADPALSTDPFLAEARAGLERAGLAGGASELGAGWGLYGWTVVDTLKRAAALSGGLSRTNVMLAARSARGAHPMIRDGVVYESDGRADPYPVEGARFVRYSAPAGAGVGLHSPFGKVYDGNGATGACPWDGTACARS